MANDDFTPLPQQPSGSVAPTDDFTPIQGATLPPVVSAPGEEGRQITVHPRGKPPPPKIAPASIPEDVAKSAGSGLAQGTESLIGLPGDIGHAADYGVLWAETHAGQQLGLLPDGETADSLMKKYRGSAMRAMLENMGASAKAVDTAAEFTSPTTSQVAGVAHNLGVPEYTPQTTPGRYAQTIASFVPGALAMPESGALGVLRGVQGAAKTLGKNIATQAVAPAIGSESAGYLTQGTPYEPYARVAGAFAPSALNAGATPLLESMTKAGQLARAQRQFTGMATDPYAVQRELAIARATQVPGAGMGEVVPGSKPMTGALTGDLGLINATRESVTNNSDLYHANPAGTGIDQQNAARVAALRNVQTTGGPESVADAIKQTHQQIEAEHNLSVQMAFDRAHSMAPGAAARTPEEIGDALRKPLVVARTAARSRESRLWNAIDPTGNLALPTGAVRSGARGVAREMERTAKPMGGEEASIFHAARSLPRVAKFSDIRALSSRAGEEMRNQLVANGGQPNVAYRRLAILKSRIDDAIAHGAHSVAQFQKRAARAKLMPTEATIGANLERERDEFIRRANTARAGEEGVSGGAGGVSTTFPGARGTSLPPAGGTRGSVRSSAVPEPLVPQFDEGAAERLKSARAASSERFRTFDRGPIAATIKTAPTTSEFKMPSSAVPGKVFRSGPAGYEAAQAYAKASGKPYLDPFVDAATESLRREAMTPEGVIDPKAFAKWQEKNSEAIRALPAEVRNKFSTAASATEVYQDAVAARKEALDGFQKSRVGAFLGIHDPEDVTKTVGSIFGRQDAVGRMRDLAQTIGHDPNAVEGLRKSIADFLIRKATSTAEAGTSGESKLNPATFQNFLRDNRATLLAAGFSESEVATMQAIGEDIKRGQRTLQATKLEGQSNTAQDMAKRMEKAAEHRPMSMFQKLFFGFEFVKEAHHFMGAKGVAAAAVAGAAKHIWSFLHDAGVGKSDELVREALINPEIAEKLIRPGIPSNEDELAKALMKHAMFSVMAGERTGLP